MSRDRIHTSYVVHPIDLSCKATEALEAYKAGHPKEDTSDLITVIDLYGKQGIVKTKQGPVILSDEAIIDIKPIRTGHPAKLQLYTRSKKTFGLMPWATFTIRLEDVDQYIQTEAVPLHTFVRQFGSRIENNYDGCVQHLHELNH
jgi:hypothetical protein